MCSKTLSDLGLLDEVNMMFHVIGILGFMHFEAPTFERITLEFFSSADFRLKTTWTSTIKHHTDTITFRLYNIDHQLTVEELGGILRLPIYGPGAIPDTFRAKSFWLGITNLS